MKIESNVISSLPRIDIQNRVNSQVKMETGPALPGHDSVEISEAARRHLKYKPSEPRLLVRTGFAQN